MIARIQIRRDTTANWVSFNPTLSDGEFGVEILTSGDKKIKIGDGVKNWNTLGYFSAGDVTYSQFMNHVNNTTDAHGIDQIKNSITSGLATANSKIDNHISNSTNAHGIDVIKTDINELETNFTNVYQNLTLHINNNTSAHGINNIKDKIDNVETDLNGKINTTDDNLSSHANNNIDAHGVDAIKTDVINLNTKIDNAETSLSEKIDVANDNLNNHIDDDDAHNLPQIRDDIQSNSNRINDLDSKVSDHMDNNTDAHGIDALKIEVNGKIDNVESDLIDRISGVESNLGTTSANLNDHIENRTDAHGIDDIKSAVEEINLEIIGLKESIENIDIVSIKGSVDTFADLPDPTNLLNGTAYIVEEDENFNGVTTIYAAVNGAWEFIGRFNIDLSNFYTKQEVNDLIQANIVTPGLVNSPHLWVVGTEYDFGDGSYGRRFTGTVTGAANTRLNSALISNSVFSRIIISGGEWCYDNNNYMPLYTTFQTYASGLYRTSSYITLVTITDTVRTNAPYDIWVRYKK